MSPISSQVKWVTLYCRKAPPKLFGLEEPYKSQQPIECAEGKLNRTLMDCPHCDKKDIPVFYLARGVWNWRRAYRGLAWSFLCVLVFGALGVIVPGWFKLLVLLFFLVAEVYIISRWLVRPVAGIDSIPPVPWLPYQWHWVGSFSIKDRPDSDL